MSEYLGFKYNRVKIANYSATGLIQTYPVPDNSA